MNNGKLVTDGKGCSFSDIRRSFKDIKIDTKEDWDYNCPYNRKHCNDNFLSDFEKINWNTKMKIFLDIDGVMVHANPQRKVDMAPDGFYQFNEIAIEILNCIIHNEEKDELILSTSHRFRFGVIEWKKIFQRRGVDVEYISVLNIPIGHRATRKTEILNWVKKCKYDSQEILIIDDDKSLNGLPENLKSRVVFTNPYTGLSKANWNDLYRILKKDELICFADNEHEK